VRTNGLYKYADNTPQTTFSRSKSELIVRSKDSFVRNEEQECEKLDTWGKDLKLKKTIINKDINIKNNGLWFRERERVGHNIIANNY